MAKVVDGTGLGAAGVEPTTADLSATAAGAIPRARRDEARARRPVRNLAARMLHLDTEERRWRSDAVGEELVGDRLEKLGPRWELLHDVEIGDQTAWIDHLLIGPAGVFAVSTEWCPRAHVRVDGESVRVDGKPHPFVPVTRHLARCASMRLTEACGFAVNATPLLVVVDAGEVTIDRSPDDVAVLMRRTVLGWLETLPVTTSPATVAAIHLRARSALTWC